MRKFKFIFFALSALVGVFPFGTAMGDMSDRPCGVFSISDLDGIRAFFNKYYTNYDIQCGDPRYYYVSDEQCLTDHMLKPFIGIDGKNTGAEYRLICIDEYLESSQCQPSCSDIFYGTNGSCSSQGVPSVKLTLNDLFESLDFKIYWLGGERIDSSDITISAEFCIPCDANVLSYPNGEDWESFQTGYLRRWVKITDVEPYTGTECSSYTERYEYTCAEGYHAENNVTTPADNLDNLTCTPDVSCEVQQDIINQNFEPYTGHTGYLVRWQQLFDVVNCEYKEVEPAEFKCDNANGYYGTPNEDATAGCNFVECASDDNWSPAEQTGYLKKVSRQINPTTGACETVSTAYSCDNDNGFYSTTGQTTSADPRSLGCACNKVNPEVVVDWTTVVDGYQRRTIKTLNTETCAYNAESYEYRCDTDAGYDGYAEYNGSYTGCSNSCESETEFHPAQGQTGYLVKVHKEWNNGTCNRTSYYRCADGYYSGTSYDYDNGVTQLTCTQCQCADNQWSAYDTSHEKSPNGTCDKFTGCVMYYRCADGYFNDTTDHHPTELSISALRCRQCECVESWTKVDDAYYEQNTGFRCDRAMGCVDNGTTYRCAKNYYSARGLASAASIAELSCTICPAAFAGTFKTVDLSSYAYGETKSAGATSVGQCYLPKGTYYDETGRKRINYDEFCWYPAQ